MVVHMVRKKTSMWQENPYGNLASMSGEYKKNISTLHNSHKHYDARDIVRHVATESQPEHETAAPISPPVFSIPPVAHDAMDSAAVPPRTSKVLSLTPSPTYNGIPGSYSALSQVSEGFKGGGR